MLVSPAYLQASHLRKTSLVVPDESQGARAVAYDPDTQHYCTIYAGTSIQQVLYCFTAFTLLPLSQILSC